MIIFIPVLGFKASILLFKMHDFELSQLVTQIINHSLIFPEDFDRLISVLCDNLGQRHTKYLNEVVDNFQKKKFIDYFEKPGFLFLNYFLRSKDETIEVPALYGVTETIHMIIENSTPRQETILRLLLKQTEAIMKENTKVFQMISDKESQLKLYKQYKENGEINKLRTVVLKQEHELLKNSIY